MILQLILEQLTRRRHELSNRSRAGEGDRPIFTGFAMVLRFARSVERLVFAVKMRQSPARERLHELILVSLTLLSFLFVWPVGEYLILDDWAFVKSLEYLHRDGRLVVLDWNPMSLTGHLLWGLIFTKCFGFSFLVTKLSVVCAGGLLVLIVYWISLGNGANPRVALLAALALLLNPLFLTHLFMYMTDVTSLTWQWLSIGCLSIGLMKSGKVQIGLLGLSSIFWALAFLTRQHGVAVPLTLTAYILMVDRSRLRIEVIGPALLPGALAAASGLYWQSLTQGPNQSLQVSSELVRDFVTNPPWTSLPYICWSYAIYVGLFAAPVVLSARWRTGFEWTKINFFLTALTAWLGFFLFIHFSMNGWYFPYIRNVMTPFGMFHPNEFLIGDRDLLWDREYGMGVGLFGLISALGWFALALPRGLRFIPSDRQTITKRPICIQTLMRLLFGFQLAYVLATAPILYDRHLLLLAPTVLVIAALASPRIGSPAMFAPGVVLLVYAVYGIACSHDIHAMSRAVFLEGKKLLSEGIDAEKIDAGYAFDGWYMYERSHSISSPPAVRLPPWWPRPDAVVEQPMLQPWWVYGLVTEVRPEFLVTISPVINASLYPNRFQYEVFRHGPRFRTYWPWTERQVSVLRCHPIGSPIDEDTTID